MLSSKKLKRKSYFIIEAINIMDKFGIGFLTSRAVADAAGFTPSSIYNYFDSLDHLENVASIHFTEKYSYELASATNEMELGLEIYIVMWEIFMKHAFKNVNIFYNVFYSSIAQSEGYNLFNEYYEIFPEQYPKFGGFILGMMNIDKTQNRGKFVLEKCVSEGSIQSDMLEYINNIHIGYTKFIITDIVKNKLYTPSTELFHQCILYIIYSMIAYVPEKYKYILEKRIKIHKNNEYSISK